MMQHTLLTSGIRSAFGRRRAGALGVARSTACNAARLAVIALAITTIAACAKDPLLTVDPQPVTLPVLDSLVFGDTTRVWMSLSADGTRESKVQWYSSNRDVAVVDSTGLVTATGVGTATLTGVTPNNISGATAIRTFVHRADGGLTFTAGSASDGSSITCGLVEMSIYCRPRPASIRQSTTFARQPGAAGVEFLSVHTSLNNVCGLAIDGRILCWGGNARFVYGIGPRPAVVTDTGPVAVRTSLRFGSISHNGHQQTCGINRPDNVVYCWGHNDSFQLAKGTRSDADSLVSPVAGNMRAKRVFTSNFATCVIDFDDAAHCAGYLARNLGVDTSQQGSAPTLLPVRGGVLFNHLAPGQHATCGISRTLEAYCWGSNDRGQVGIGRGVTIALTPQRVGGDLKFTTVESIGDGQAACAISVANDLYCWGAFRPGSVANKIGDAAWKPYPLLKGMKFTALMPSISSVCALTTGGRVYCWQ